MSIRDVEDAEVARSVFSPRAVEVYSDFLADMAAAQNWYADFLSRRTGLTAGRILGFMRDGISLFAKDAIDCGLVHEIIPVPSMITLGD